VVTHPNYAGGIILRRNQTDIVKEILSVTLENEVTKTQIVYRCNLSFEYARRLLDTLIQDRLIEAIEKDGKKTFKITKKGSSYLKSLKEAYEIRKWNYEAQ